MEFRNQLKLLIQLSLVDNKLSNTEKRMIYILGKANGIPEKDIDEAFDQLLSKRSLEFPALETLTEDDKFDYLYNLIQLMKVDKNIYLSEVKFCENLAVKLGFKKKIISKLSSRIYSDPGMTTDRSALQKIISKYKIDS